VYTDLPSAKQAQFYIHNESQNEKKKMLIATVPNKKINEFRKWKIKNTSDSEQNRKNTNILQKRKNETKQQIT